MNNNDIIAIFIVIIGTMLSLGILYYGFKK